jgi:plastocyanin
LRIIHSILLVAACSAFAHVAPSAQAQGVDVTAQVILQSKSPAPKRKTPISPVDVVVWLTPLQPDSSHHTNVEHPGPFRLVQKDKQFTPHMVVVPTGTSVEFPNKDPFFHNVFSLFNGKRFDLGLYESGTTRSVRFDREGVSYIFCNIHPEMGAIVLALSTPYYAVSDNTGAVILHNVPPGTYSLHVWSETAQSAKASEVQGTVQVGLTALQLGDLHLEGTADPMKHHMNKFGEEYRPSHDAPY